MVCAPLALAVTFTPGRAAADIVRQRLGTAKGTVGGGLLGAELVLAVEAAAGVKSPWLYLAGGVVGARRRGGWLLHRKDSSPRVSCCCLPATHARHPDPRSRCCADRLRAARRLHAGYAARHELVADPPQPPPLPGDQPPATAPTSRAPAKRLASHARSSHHLHVMPPALFD